jgi:hypothetical protein
VELHSDEELPSAVELLYGMALYYRATSGERIYQNPVITRDAYRASKDNIMPVIIGNFFADGFDIGVLDLSPNHRSPIMRISHPAIRSTDVRSPIMLAPSIKPER